ncbi:MAG: hypothetical protein JNL67_23305 [Planctomycetaceae bacterium]|nr:hypothetical protein [Planctomycetaceae bacterium]
MKTKIGFAFLATACCGLWLTTHLHGYQSTGSESGDSVVMTSTDSDAGSDPEKNLKSAAVKGPKLRPSRTQTVPAGFEAVEMFSAAEAGSIEITYIPKDATQASVWFENKTDKPLSVELPEVFAFVPVMAQMAGMGAGGGMGGMGGGMGMGGMGGMGGGMGNQGGMGGFGGGGMGGGMGGMGGGMGGGMFNIPPGMKVRTKVTTVCLEHGKKDPRAGVAYTMVPIEKFVAQFPQSYEIIETGRLLTAGQISQPVAQAAAWHYTDKMSWAELLDKNRVVLRNGYVEKFFSREQVAAAQQVATHVAQLAEAKRAESQSSVSENYNKD